MNEESNSGNPDKLSESVELDNSSLNDFKEKTSLKPTKELTAEEKKIQRENAIRYSIARIRELRNLFHYLEEKNTTTRHSRKQFRRDFYNNSEFPDKILQDVIDFYSLELGEKSENVVSVE